MEISQVIKYEGPNDILVWKHPVQDFNTTTQLIVHESQEAIFFRNGQALDLFAAGRYTLETENIPLVNKLINIPTNGKTPFHCEVYFINKVDIMDILWGTSTPIPIEDPKYSIILPVRANGQFGLRVEDSRKFLLKLIGTTTYLGKEGLTSYFRGFLMTRIKDYISNLMVEKRISFLEIHSHLNEISDALKQQISLLYEEYGLTIVNFFVNSITVPNDDPGYLKIRNALAAAKEKQILATGKRAEMDLLGYTYQQERTFNVLDKAAQNEGTASNIMGAGVGLGMGMNIGGTLGSSMGNALSNIPSDMTKTEQKTECPNCHKQLPPNAKFCLDCGTPIESISADITCPNCKAKTPKGKFCLNCGHKIINICKKCQKELPDNAKFCLECGERVD
jgi:membrane protease subunit (stomatin/prohibitin family)